MSLCSALVTVLFSLNFCIILFLICEFYPDGYEGSTRCLCKKAFLIRWGVILLSTFLGVFFIAGWGLANLYSYLREISKLPWSG